MIKQADKDKAKKLGLDLDAIIAAHGDAKEVDVVIPDGELFTPDQLTARDTVKLGEGKKEGEKEAFNIAKTELGKHGFDIKATRFGDMGKELSDKMNATNDDKIKGLQDQNTLLIKKNGQLETERDKATTSLRTGMLELDIISKIPAGVDTTPKERFELAKMRGYSFEENEGAMSIKKGGEWLRDKTTQAILPIDAGLKLLIDEQKWTPTAVAEPVKGGRGVVQKVIPTGGGAPKNKSEAEAIWNEQNPDRNFSTPEGMAYYNEMAKQPGFNMYE